GSGWGASMIGLSAVVLMMVFRRWRHLLVFLCSLLLLELAIQFIAEGMTRPRPYGVTIIAGWAGYSAGAVGDDPDVLAGEHRLLPGRAGAAPLVREGGDRGHR